VKGSLGLAQDPSEFSLACRQTGPITLPAKLPESETVFSEDTSLVFKETKVVRMFDRANNALVYLAISRKVIEGAPANSISTVPVMPWGGR
jgi:CreA protein